MTEPGSDQPMDVPEFAGVDPVERNGLISIAERLREERPIPAAGFRGRLRRHLLARAGREPGAPRRLRLAIAAYAGSGLGLLAVAAVGVAGAGPLAA